MIELENVIINKSKFNKGNPLSLKMEKGIFELKDDLAKIKKLILLKSQRLDEGNISIDGHDLIKTFDDEATSGVFCLTINSSSSVINAFFAVENEKREALIKNLKEELIKLKELPTNTKEEHANKIKEELGVLKNNNVSYLFIDKNVKINKEHAEEIFVSNKEELNSVLTIVDPLTEKDYGNHEVLNKKTKKEAKKADEKEEPEVINHTDNFMEFDKEVFDKNFFHVLASCFIKNVKVLLFTLVPVLGAIGFLLLAPYHLANDNASVGILLIVGASACTILYFAFEVNMYDFYKYKNDQHRLKKYWSITILNLLFMLIAFGLGVGLFFLIGSIDQKADLSTYEITMIIPAIITAFVLLLSPIYVRYLRMLVVSIKLLFVRKGK